MTWRKRIVWILGIVLTLSVLGFAFENASPGLVMRPVRKIAANVGIEIPVREATTEEKARAREMAVKWKAEFLEKFPILEVTPRPVPDGENGFLMLWELDQREGISPEFQDLLIHLEDFDADVARRVLQEHQDFIDHVEKIADMTATSSIEMPEAYDGFFNARRMKRAHDVVLFKACLAAHEGVEKEALRCMQMAGNLGEHLAGIETPTFLTETIAILFSLARCHTILDVVLPKLGPQCDLSAWQTELNRLGDYSPQRYAELLRGEWQTGADHFAFEYITIATLTGEIRDGKGCAFAYTEWMASQAAELQNATALRVEDLKTKETDFKHLPKEQREFMPVFVMGTSSWAKGFLTSSQTHARARAAIDLLILERDEGSITPADTTRITRDPISGEPFVFDPESRTLSAPHASSEYQYEPIKLPW